MVKKYDFKGLFAEAEKSLAYWVEGAVLDFTSDMLKAMETQGVSRSELARRIDASPAYITKILRGSTNFTLESMVKVAMALDCEFKPHLQPKKSSVQAPASVGNQFVPWMNKEGSLLFSSSIASLSYTATTPECANQEAEDDSLAAVA
mgnify:CR=1 FL=1